ncbi:MAG: ATP-binding cassette domain-containing protein [Thermoleophilia bacterium]|jgi:energy-coupling factor transport system ATP-binding protein
MIEPIISLDNVTYRYPHAPEAAALEGISLSIRLGEFIGLVGANGSGKSTLARLLNALIIPDSGEVLVDGLKTDERANVNAIRETVGMVFQNPDSQIVATSVEDDIAFGLENLGLPPDEIDRRVAESAVRFRIEKLLAMEPHWLSGGQKQRTVLAGVVALKPKVLVFDEPTSMLDPLSQQEFHGLVGELWRAGTTIVMITHIMEELVQASRVIALAAGKVEFDGTPRDLFSSPGLMNKAGLLPPLAVRLNTSLAARGLNLPIPLSLAELVESICA